MLLQRPPPDDHPRPPRRRGEPAGLPPKTGPPLLTPRTEAHVRGRRCWIHTWVTTFALLYLVALALTAIRWSEDGITYRSWWCVTKMFCCTFIAALVWVWYLWHSTTREGEVPPGLLISVWFTTGTVSVACCSVCNWSMVQLWSWMDPYCYITYPADNWPWSYTSRRCVFVNMVQWILTAGIIEETFKFASLLRLQPTRAKIQANLHRRRCGDRWRSCCGLLPRAWVLRLADSPISVALCGVAAGGGLATTENFMYIFSQESIRKAFTEGDLESAFGRVAASFAHMVWTGYAACGLAKWQFLEPHHPHRPRRRTSYLLAPIVLHGLFNWCSTLQRCEPYEDTYDGKQYSSDGCYVSPTWRMVFKAGHLGVVLLSFYLWHAEFSEIADGDFEEELAGRAAQGEASESSQP